MEKVKQGIFGEVKSKVGNLVGCTWKGTPYMRARPSHMTNPQTEKQQSQRGKFMIAMDFLRPITPFIRYGYLEFTESQSAFNAAMSYLMKNAFTGSGESLALDYNKVLVTRYSDASRERCRDTRKQLCPVLLEQ